MYVEFEFSNHIHLMAVIRRLDAWQQRYRIPIRQKTVKYCHRVGMDHEENFTIFFLTWQGFEYRVIHNRNH